MRIIPICVLMVLCLAPLAQAQIPLGKYADKSDFFRFLPDQRVEYRFTNEACLYTLYEGTGTYVLKDGFISIQPDKPKGVPDSLVRKKPSEDPAGPIKIRVVSAEDGLPITGAVIAAIDGDGRVISGQITDEHGDAVIRMPQQGKLLSLAYIGFGIVDIPDASSQYSYEVFMTYVPSTKEYFNFQNGGLQYKILKDVFSINRKTFSCTSQSGCLEWFDYKKE